MPVTITLTHAVSTTDAGKTQLVLHSEGARITSKVFACEVIPSTADSDTTARFSHVCSPMELVEFPEDTPGSSSYFRVCDLTLIFDTVQLASRTLEHMQADIAHLVTEMNELEAIGETYGTGTAIQTATVLSAATEIQFSADGESWHATQTTADTYLRFRNSALAGDWSTTVNVPFQPKRNSVSDAETAVYTIASLKAGYDYHLGTLTSLTVTELETSDTDSTAWFTAGTDFTLVLPSGTGVIGTSTYTAGQKYVIVFRNGTAEIKHIA